MYIHTYIYYIYIYIYIYIYSLNHDRKQKNLIVFKFPNQNFLCIFREQKKFVEKLGFEGPKTLVTQQFSWNKI